jgi:hypothetical protein
MASASRDFISRVASRIVIMRTLTHEELKYVAGGFSLIATNVANGSQAGALGGSGTITTTNGVGVNSTSVGLPIGNEAAGNNVNSSGGTSTLTVIF